MKLIVGIDEVGRGPLAGPVTVGLFGAEKKMEKWLLKNLFQNKLRDSKKLSVKKREEIYKRIIVLKKEDKVFYKVTHVSNKIIDKKGISFAIKSAIAKNLNKLQHKNSWYQGRPGTIRLDGGLKAPIEFKNQKTILKGDERDVFIACASIMAKVSRDALICRLAKKYPAYAFHIHKGYGTKLHRQLIKKHGISDLHRASFCARLGAW